MTAFALPRSHVFEHTEREGRQASLGISLLTPCLRQYLHVKKGPGSDAVRKKKAHDLLLTVPAWADVCDD